MTFVPPIASLLFLYAETPLHVGSGSALGAVDLPIQRERVSGLPMVQGSGVKGALRAELRQRIDKDHSKALFGREAPTRGDADSEDDKAGAIAVLDARLLLFPIRTVWGGFAWVTSPIVLQRLARDLELGGASEEALALAIGKLQPRDSSVCLVGQDAVVARDNKIFLEDFEYEAKESEELALLARWLREHAFPALPSYEPFRARLTSQLAIVADEELQFLSSHATEVVSRIRVDAETGVVADGALWTEEALPAESLLWSVVLVSAERPERVPSRPDRERERLEPRTALGAGELHGALVRALEQTPRLRLGGDRSIGRGLIGARLRGAPQRGGQP